MQRSGRRRVSLYAVVGLLTVGSAACGSGDEEATTASPAATTEAAPTEAASTEAATTDGAGTATDAATAETAETDTAETTAPAGEPLVLTGDTTTLVLDATTAAVLGGLGVKVGPIAPARSEGDGIAFPITGGSVQGDTLAGTIEHGGGLRFTAGGTNVDVTDFVVDTTAGTLTATAAGEPLPLLALDLSGLQRSTEGDTIVASGIRATLAPAAARALNEAFGVDALAAGLPVGTVTVRARV